MINPINFNSLPKIPINTLLTSLTKNIITVEEVVDGALTLMEPTFSVQVIKKLVNM